MRIPSTLLLLVSIFYLPTPPIIVHSQVLCIEKEKHALLDFKQSFVADPLGVLSTWRIDNHDCCNWTGIDCDEDTGHVSWLTVGSRLESYRLRPSLLELKHLGRLILAENELTMRIPEFIGSLSELGYLDLSNSGFYGKIPPSLGNLTLLGVLHLGDPATYLYADDFQWLSHLSSLSGLKLSNVNSSSATDWFSTITMLPSLSDFYCSSCSFPPTSCSSRVNSSSALQYLYLSSSIMSFSTLSCFINSTNELVELYVYNMNLEHNVHAFLEALIRRARHSLVGLYLSGNNLRELPFEVLMKFPLLLFLELSSNQLDKLSPQDIKFTMPNLEELDISHNHIYMLPDLSASSSLIDLDASFNRISGNPQEIFHRLPTNLTDLDLSGNSMNGAISEAHLSKFSQLVILKLSDNNLLTFNFSETWVKPFQLYRLELRSCKLGPSFPNWILTHTIDLEYLDISNTSISEAIPTAFWNFSTRISNFNVSFNNIKCLVPDLRLSFSVSAYIDLSSNSLYGPVPPFLFTTAWLDLSNNRFSSFSHFHHKILTDRSRVVDLSNNRLSGVLPNWLFQFDGLVILNLADNMLSGTLPTAIGSLSNLITLHLNNNRFYGQVPLSMENCSHLKILELTNNYFSGAVPFWLGESLVKLVALNLRSNNFSGELPSSLCLLQSLHVLDLSNNRISGFIPACVHNFTSMTTDKDLSLVYRGMSKEECSKYSSYDRCLDYAAVIWKGLLAHDYNINLQQRNVIDLSSNHLTGQIPVGITALKWLRSLDLSGNFLNGSIPDKIGELKYLEVLMLSSNRLSGEIPTSLASLTFLAKLNMSDNNLCGRIPTSTQLQSFDPSSYAGNSKLCGKPLPNKCPWDKEVEVRPPLGHEEDGKPFDMQAFYAALGTGFAFGFWGILGMLNFNAKWRLAFFGMASNITDWILVRTALCQSRIQTRLCF